MPRCPPARCPPARPCTHTAHGSPHRRLHIAWQTAVSCSANPTDGRCLRCRPAYYYAYSTAPTPRSSGHGRYKARRRPPPALRDRDAPRSPCVRCLVPLGEPQYAFTANPRPPLIINEPARSTPFHHLRDLQVTPARQSQRRVPPTHRAAAALGQLARYQPLQTRRHNHPARFSQLLSTRYHISCLFADTPASHARRRSSRPQPCEPPRNRSCATRPSRRLTQVLKQATRNDIHQRPQRAVRRGPADA